MGGAFQTVLPAAASVASVPQYDDGATMDAAVAPGDIVELIGTTTRARVALLECATIGPVTYYARSDIDLYQADGDEFTGVLDFRALGTGTVPTWAGSTAGAVATGGPKLAGTGTTVLDGLALFGGGRCTFDVVGYLTTRPTATTNYVVCAGLVRASDETLGCFGGWGRGGSGWANCANTDAAVDSYTPSFNSNYGAQPDQAEVWGIGLAINPYNGAPSAGVQVTGGAWNAGQSALQGSVNDASSGFATATNLRAAVYINGDWVYRLSTLIIKNG